VREISYCGHTVPSPNATGSPLTHRLATPSHAAATASEPTS
jgi:hypothetical protein